MPDLLTVLSRWWKRILFLVLAATSLALIICLLQPKQYKSVATALPANSLTADPARLFNKNIEGLYSALGSPDELDRIEGTATLDTIYLAAARQHRLVDRYEIEDSRDPEFAAAQRLRKNSRIARSPYGELKVTVWDQQPAMAATLANSLLASLQQIHRQLQVRGQQNVLDRLERAYKNLASDTLNATSDKDTGAAYRQLIAEYRLAMEAAPDALLVVEPARPQPWPDRPRTGLVVALSAASALVFGLLLAYFLQSRRPL